MKRIIIIILLPLLALLYLGCNNKVKEQEKSYLVKNIQNSKLIKYVSDFVSQYPEGDLYSLYFIKYDHDTCRYLLLTQPPLKDVVFEDDPEDIIKVNGRYVLINYGINHLLNYDSTRAEIIIKKLEENKFKFYTSDQLVFTNSGIFIDVSQGKYSIDNSPIHLVNGPPSSYLGRKEVDFYREYLRKSKQRSKGK